MKRYFYLLLVCLLVVGCKKEDENAPEQQPQEQTQPTKPDQPDQPDPPQPEDESVENPNWKVTVENDLTTSMTVIVRVSVSEQEGSLAAFMGEACCEVATYDAVTGLYWMYISPATEEGGDVQLRFYSTEHKRIYDATTTFPFSNYSKLGTVAEPYTPEWVVSQ